MEQYILQSDLLCNSHVCFAGIRCNVWDKTLRFQAALSNYWSYGYICIRGSPNIEKAKQATIKLVLGDRRWGSDRRDGDYDSDQIFFPGVLLQALSVISHRLVRID